jgi:HK97 family phage prohead protease
MIYGYKTFELQVKDLDQKLGIVTGYFSAFDKVDSDRDIIRKGAFVKSIQENGPESKGRVKHLLNHDPSKPLGLITVLKEDDYGLYYESKVGTHSLGQDFIKMVESGLIKEHSIGFSTIKQNQIGDWKKDDNSAVWEILEVKLYEGSSLTAWGANEYTPLLDMKGVKLQDISDRIKAFEKFVRNTDATDETIELCLLQIKQLGELVESMTTQPAEAVEPDDEAKKLREAIILLTIENFNNGN